MAPVFCRTTYSSRLRHGAHGYIDIVTVFITRTVIDTACSEQLYVRGLSRVTHSRYVHIHRLKANKSKKGRPESSISRTTRSTVPIKMTRLELVGGVEVDQT